MAARVKAKFTPPMLLLRTDRLPEGEAWAYEIKWDGYRAIAFKTGGKVPRRKLLETKVLPKLKAPVRYMPA